MTIEEIKQTYSILEIATRYGIHVPRNGKIKCLFHKEKTASMKLYQQSYYCFGCGVHGDVISFLQGITGFSFQEALQELGKDKKTSFSAYVKARQAQIKAKSRQQVELERKKRLKNTLLKITAYRNLIAESEPFSDLWCYCNNQLPYQYGILEEAIEERGELFGRN